MKVFDSPSNERARRLASQISKNGSSMDMVRNYIEKIRNSVPESPAISTMGRPTVNPVQLKSQSPVNPDLAPELYNMIPLMYDVPLVTSPYGVDEQERPENLFSDEAKARRRLKQAYAESAFQKGAQSKAGAKGLFQIMDITHKDYLGRGRGKKGDIYDPEYNGGIRDWVMGIIPRDLQEFWSDSDSDRNKLAKLYAAYNWGAGNLRGYLRKKQNAGIDISNPDNWVEDLNPETRRYVKYLAFDEDIPDSIYTNEAFEDAARKNGYMRYGGKIHIKPENRGKFTALKKRTGHSASWFKAHGTPAQKKMATFAINSRKWRHGDGGFLNMYDGETEETQQMKRTPWWKLPVRVPNMTGTATAAATGLRDIPLTDSTVGTELGVAAASAWPLIPYLGTQAALGIDMMGRMAMPSTFLKGVASYAPGIAGTVGAVSPWLDAGALSLWSAQAGQGAIDAAKEGRTGDAIGMGVLSALPIVMPLGMKGYQSGKNYFNKFRLSPYDIDLSAIGADLDRSELLQRGDYARSLLNRYYALSDRASAIRGYDPSHPEHWRQMQQAYAYNRRGVWRQLQDAANAADVPLNEFLGNPEVAQLIYGPVRNTTSRLQHSLSGLRNTGNWERYRRQSANISDLQNLNETIRLALNPESRAILSESERFPALIQPATNAGTRGMLVEPPVNTGGILNNDERIAGLVNDLGLEAVPEERTIAQIASSPSAVAETAARSSAFEGVNDEDLMRMFRRSQWQRTENTPEEIAAEIRSRARERFHLNDDLSDLTGLSNEQLLSMSPDWYTQEGRDLRNANFNLSEGENGFVDLGNLRDRAIQELRNRLSSRTIPASYSSLEDAANDFRLYDRVRMTRAQDEVVRNVIPDLRVAIGNEQEIPREFANAAERLTKDMVDAGVIPTSNSYFQKWLSSQVGDYDRRNLTDLLKEYARLHTGSSYVEDNSSRALADLVNRFGKRLTPERRAELSRQFGRNIGEWEFYDYRDLLDQINNMDSLPEATRKEMQEIINSAYKPLQRRSLRPHQAELSKLIENAIYNKLPSDFDRSVGISSILDVNDPNYIQLAERLRGAGATELPTDVDHLSWFQVSSASNNPVSEAEKNFLVGNATTKTGIQTELLTRALPRQTAIVEHNTSPNSYKVMTKGSLRAKEGFGYGPGQVTLEPVNLTDVVATSGNNAQLRNAKFDARGNIILGQPTAGADKFKFTKGQAEKFVNDTERMSDLNDFIDYLRNNPDAVKLIDEAIGLSKAMNEADIKDVSRAMKFVNDRRSALGREAIGYPTVSETPLTSDMEGYWERDNMHRIKWDAIRMLRSMMDDYSGYAPTMKRSPVITLKHKYGGILDKYGNDAVRSAISRLKLKK